ncbi:MAG: hypothetical protein HOO67_03320 [Candidatus Peribacteraceae bacterium]|nr:hypothetical protein [Candidatus Peribacteraceae bacterium]
MKQQHCLGFAFESGLVEPRVLLTTGGSKTGVGGLVITPTESPATAMSRLATRLAGAPTLNWKPVVTIEFPDNTLFVFAAKWPEEMAAVGQVRWTFENNLSDAPSIVRWLVPLAREVV